MRRVATAVLAGLLLLVPVASAEGPVGANVDINFGAVSPTPVAIVAGESVHWTNASVRNHTVTADDGSYDSGTLSPNFQFEHTFTQAGTYTYHCRIHPTIRGEVDVYDLLLDRPAAPAATGKPYPISGRSSLAPDTPVSIQFDDGSGSGFQEIAQTTVGPDGHFAVDVSPATSGSFRAASGDSVSPAVQLLVLNSSVSARARSVRGGTRVSVSVTPVTPGGTVVLQLHLRERFGWWPVQQRKLGKNSTATFRVPLARHVAARVLLTLPDGATALATSPTFKVAPLPRR